MFQIPGGAVLEPADLGLNAVTLPAAGVIVTGAVIPWASRFKIRAVQWRADWTNTGATPFQLLIAGGSILLGSLSTNSTIGSNFTNNPIPYVGYASRGANGGSVLTGALLVSPFPFLFGAHSIRWAFINSHATIAVADMSLTVTVFE